MRAVGAARAALLAASALGSRLGFGIPATPGEPERAIAHIQDAKYRVVSGHMRCASHRRCGQRTTRRCTTQFKSLSAQGEREATGGDASVLGTHGDVSHAIRVSQ